LKLCIQQVFRPKYVPKIKIEGVGDCSVCKPDKNNRNCRNYYPITINIVEVECNRGEKENA
jgi:hypothetical protein